jgi:hypothetical protein
MSNGDQPEDHTRGMVDADAQDLGLGISIPHTPDDGINAPPIHGPGNPLTNANTQFTHISDGNTGVQIYEPPVYNQPALFTQGANETGRATSSNSRVAVEFHSRQGYTTPNSGRPPDLMNHGRRRPMV